MDSSCLLVLCHFPSGAGACPPPFESVVALGLLLTIGMQWKGHSVTLRLCLQRLAASDFLSGMLPFESGRKKFDALENTMLEGIPSLLCEKREATWKKAWRYHKKE